MKMLIEVELPIKIVTRKGKHFFEVGNTETLIQLMGTSSVIGNYQFYDVEKTPKKNIWLVPLDVLKNRIEVMEERIATSENRLTIMRQILKQCQPYLKKVKK